MQGQPGRMEIGTAQAPEHRPLGRKPRQNPGQKSGCDGTILAFRPFPSQLVQRPQRQAAPRQACIDGGDRERQNRYTLAAVFDRGQKLPEGSELRSFSTIHREPA